MGLRQAFRAPAPSLGRTRPRVPSSGAGSQRWAAVAAGVFPPCARSPGVSAPCRRLEDGSMEAGGRVLAAALPGARHTRGQPQSSGPAGGAVRTN